MPLKPGSVFSRGLHENKSLASSREEVQRGLYLSMRKTVWSLGIMRKGQLLQSRTHYTPEESYPFGVLLRGTSARTQVP